MRYDCLKQAWKEAQSKPEREHVTLFFHNHAERFKIGNFKGPEDWSALRWTVDELDDFELVTKIYEALFPRNPAFSFSDILAFLKKNPDFKTLNTSHPRNEGLKKSFMRPSQR